MSQSSTRSLIWEEPRKTAHSIDRPVRCWISATGRMSASSVRAAQFGSIFMPERTISSASAVTSRTAWAPAPGRPRFTESRPRSAMWCRISIFCSTLGEWTDGDCRPSRSVSSSKVARWAGFGGASTRFQS